MARTRSFDEAPPRPASDAYTGLLALSLIAMVASCVVMYLDYSQYLPQGTKPPAPNIPAVGPKTPAINQGQPAASQAPNTGVPITTVAATEPAAAPMPVPVEPQPAPSLLPAPSDGPPVSNQ